jgi:hypothetical protein
METGNKKQYKKGLLGYKKGRVHEILCKDVAVIKVADVWRWRMKSVKSRAQGLKEILSHIVIERDHSRIKKVYRLLDEQRRLEAELKPSAEGDVGAPFPRKRFHETNEEVTSLIKEIVHQTTGVTSKPFISGRDSVLMAGHHFKDLVLFTHKNDEVIFKQYRDQGEPHQGRRERAGSDPHQLAIGLLTKAWRKPNPEATEQAIFRGKTTYRSDMTAEPDNGDTALLPYASFGDLLHFCRREERGKYEREQWTYHHIYFEFQHLTLWKDRTPKGRVGSSDRKEAVHILCKTFGVTPEVVKKAIKKMSRRDKEWRKKERRRQRKREERLLD